MLAVSVNRVFKKIIFKMNLKPSPRFSANTNKKKRKFNAFYEKRKTEYFTRK